MSFEADIEPMTEQAYVASVLAAAGEPGPVADRRQRAREAFQDEYDRAGGSTFEAAETAIETATRVRVDEDVCEAAQQAFPIFTSIDEVRAVAVAAFRAAGFEVEE